MIVEKVYTRPIVLSHQIIRFETAQSWNPGKGKHDHPGTGNDGIKFPVETNPNPQPCGAGTAGQGGGNKGIGQCNPNVNP
jgi:hypothetical protein